MISTSIATDEKPARPKQSLQATFVSDSNAIAVASSHVIRMFRSCGFIQRISHFTITNPSAIEPEGATDENWNVYSNGG